MRTILLLAGIYLTACGFAQQYTTLVADDFEDGYGNWTDAGADSKYYRYPGSGFNSAYRGEAAIELQENDAADTDSRMQLAAALDISGYDRIRVDFAAMAWDHEPGDGWYVEVYDGQTWQTMETFRAGIDYVADEKEGYQLWSLEYDRADFAFSENFNFRFVCNTNSVGDDLFLDNVSIAAAAGPGEPSAPAATAPLFEPVGYGSGTTGGSGGRIIKVTSLANEGPGTFRAACDSSGARIVIFEVSGVITLTRSLTIYNGDITIAGQTAPGDGITLVNGPENDKPTLKIKAKNVIVQYLKLRPGDAMKDLLASQLDQDNNVDAITVTGGGDSVVIDHLSLSWSIDETVQLWSAKNVSLQHNIIAESLTRSLHPKTVNENQAHGCAILVGQKKGEQGGNVTIYQNLMAHNSRRNPRLSCALPVEVVNNVMYNTGGAPWGLHQPIVLADDPQNAGSYDFVGNYLKPGPSTSSTASATNPPYHFIGDLGVLNPNTRIHAKGNQFPPTTAELHGKLIPYVVDQPTSDTQLPALAATQAYDRVLADAGDCWRLNSDGSRSYRRDALDTRWVNDVMHGLGTWVDVPRRLPPHEAGVANLDSDGDGMPDNYEDRFAFLDKNEAGDGPEDKDGDGITNVEEFLFGTSPGEAIATGPACAEAIAAGTFQLLARHSGKALAVDLNPSTNGGFFDTDSSGVNVFQYGTSTADNRLWDITPVAGGYYKLISVHSGKALAVDLNELTNGGHNAATDDGANIFQYGTDNRANRLWRIESVDGDDGCYRKLTNKYSEKVLDVSGISTADGANVHQWEYVGGLNQQWKLVPYAPPAAAVQLSASAARAAASWQIYPNPAHGQLTVEGQTEYAVTLYDLSGREVLRQARLAGTTQLDISALPAGLYVVSVRAGEGEVIRKRVVVE